MEDLVKNFNGLKISINEKKFNDVRLIREFKFEIKRGEYVSILGKSGVGKSTLLRMISGIDLDYSGTIEFENKLISEPKRDITFLFQNNFLLPWLTVKENIKFISSNISDKQVETFLEFVGLEDRINTYPNKLSGGEIKRIGLSVALVNKSKLLLLDEPYSDLDIGVKKGISDLLNRIVKENNTTVIMTTHNIEDALALGNRVVVLKGKPLYIAFDSSDHTTQSNDRLRDLITDLLLEDTDIY